MAEERTCDVGPAIAPLTEMYDDVIKKIHNFGIVIFVQYKTTKRKVDGTRTEILINQDLSSRLPAYESSNLPHY